MRGFVVRFVKSREMEGKRIAHFLRPELGSGSFARTSLTNSLCSVRRGGARRDESWGGGGGGQLSAESLWSCQRRAALVSIREELAGAESSGAFDSSVGRAEDCSGMSCGNP